MRRRYVARYFCVWSSLTKILSGLKIQNSKVTAAQLTTDYKGADYTASLTIGNPNIINESGVFVGHYLQSVTKQLALGGELAYQYGPAVPGGQMAVMSAAAR